MKIISLLLIGGFFLFGCKIQIKKKDVIHDIDTIANAAIKPNFAIDTMLLAGIEEIYSITTNKEIGNIPLDSIAMAIIFLDHSNYQEDNKVYITYYLASTIFLDNINDSDYKGATNINGHTILVFDKSDIGSPYYDSTQLIRRPLLEIYAPAIPVSLYSFYYIKDSGLRKNRPM